MKKAAWKKYPLFLIPIGIFILLVVHFSTNSRLEDNRRLSNESPSSQEVVGKHLASFTMRNINGTSYSTQEEITGKCLFVFFSASDCAVCLTESKYWQMLHISATTKVLGVTRDKNLNKLKRFLDLYKITFPVLHDQQGKLFSELKIEHTPVKILIDGNKIIRKIDQTTYMDEGDFKKSLYF